MKFLLSLTLLVLGATSLLAQKPQTDTSPTESVVLSEEGDSPVILFDKKEITRSELAALDPTQIGDIQILNGAEANKRFGKYKKNGAIVVSSTPPTDVVSSKTMKAVPSAPAEQVETLSEGKVKISLGSELNAHVVIDGEASTMETLQAMKPDQIMSIDILKAAAATKKYGALAKEGAIEVKTKQ